MVIVDSSVWIDYLRGTENSQTRWLDDAVGEESIGLTSLILCEVLQGVSDEMTFRRFKKDLMQFDVFDGGSVDLAVASAENYLTLRRKGFTIRKTMDCLIATFCIQEEYSLLHRDRDFDVFESQLGLRVLHPSNSPLH
jgi:predicted nucleic acid-binding protein